MIKIEQIIAGLIVVLLGFVVWATIKEAKEWSQFKEQHNCKVIGEVSGSSSIGTGITTNGTVGTVTVYTPGKTGYLCDNGVEYWR